MFQFKRSIVIAALAAVTIPPVSGKGISRTVPQKAMYPQSVSLPVTNGLENVIVETYYISDANDATDTTGGLLAVGSTTYRIYIDLAAGYQLQAIYGSSTHTCYINTSTVFFNNLDRGTTLGSQINKNTIGHNTVALDSWLSLGGATSGQMGILKTSDTDGSKVGGSHSDGGSAGIAGGILANTNAGAGVPLTTEDGLVTSSVIPQVTILGCDLSAFDGGNTGSSFTITDGSLASLNGVTGPTTDNQILIAQLTTTGSITFELNIQVKGPDGTIQKYVAANPQGTEIQFPGLARH